MPKGKWIDIFETDVQDQLEKWVDTYGLESVLEALACVCYDKEMQPIDGDAPSEIRSLRESYKRTGQFIDGLVEDLHRSNKKE